jgi:hypothetical protein
VSTILLDPTAEREPVHRQLAARPERLEGLTIGLLDISKPRGDVFLERLSELLTERGLRVERFRKPTYTKPAPMDLRQEVASRSQAVIEALAD